MARIHLKCSAALAAFFLIGAASTAEAAACSRALPAGASQAVVPASGINQPLIDEAIRAEVNYQRCVKGMTPLSPAKRLRHAALGHSRWMASTAKLSHRSTAPGKRTISQRVRSQGIDFRFVAENIAVVHRYRVDNKKVQIIDRAQCKFQAREEGIVPPHSYASLARHAVNLWMSSPKHRKNILHKRVAFTGTAVEYSQDPRYCGKYWLTQTFLQKKG